ncbi:Phosphoethanolamine N-methyltransferase [Echria macrotheca]|uniref:Phosphoethanolamine N-methyltransferase n=1 Tax=Echria macrotheca TaxID=438768 RepID=A0AAJ0FAC0_9PEZI|nr:Phosphoethanolamine N-methyltransferase [Echria macrotheca]
MSAMAAGGNHASVASSASTVIAVAPQIPSDDEELYAAIGTAGRRPRTSAAPADSASASSGSMPGSTSGRSTGQNDSDVSDSSNGASTQILFQADIVKHSASMSSSVRAHVYEGGLRYHAFRDGKYPFPNDEIEQNRDDMKHSMSIMVCHGAYFLAPVEDRLRAGGEVLDLGTGTGIWAIELGDKYPDTKIIGIDLSPIQPDFVPENVHFFVDDFEEDWVEPQHKYDYIHVRHTLHCIRDRKALYRRAMRHLKPGGYLEFQELEYWPRCDDDTLTPETPYAVRDYIKYMEAGMRAYGAELHAVRSLAAELREAGFEDVRSTTHKAPIGLWPLDRRLRICGALLQTAFLDGLRGLSRRPLTALGWTQLQIEMFLVDVRKALSNQTIHAYLPFHDVYARKPMSCPSD